MTCEVCKQDVSRDDEPSYIHSGVLCFSCREEIADLLGVSLGLGRLQRDRDDGLTLEWDQVLKLIRNMKINFDQRAAASVVTSQILVADRDLVRIDPKVAAWVGGR